MFKITLRQARELSQFSEQVVFEKTGIPVQNLHHWEKDSSEMKYDDFRKLIDLYGIPIDYIYIGPQEAASGVNVKLMSVGSNPFDNLPDFIIVVASETPDGRYATHVRLNDKGDCKTCGVRLSLSKTLSLVDQLLESLGLESNAVMFVPQSRINLDDSEHPLSQELIEQIVVEGNVAQLSQYSMESIRAFNDFDINWTVKEQEERRRDVIEALKRQISRVIREKQKHCGQPLTVRGLYDFETELHALHIRCEHCGRSLTISEKDDQGQIVKGA